MTPSTALNAIPVSAPFDSLEEATKWALSRVEAGLMMPFEMYDFVKAWVEGGSLKDFIGEDTTRCELAAGFTSA